MMKKLSLLPIIILLIASSVIAQMPQKITLSNDLQLVKLTENTWLHVSFGEMPGFGRFSSNGLIVIQNNQAFLLDTPVSNDLTSLLIAGIKDSLYAQVIGFIPNHWHNDCMGGLEYLHNIGVHSYANQMTIDIAREKGLPYPQTGFTDSLILTLGKLEIHCFYPGAAHSTDNIVVWLPDEKILFPGCIVKELNSQSLGNTADGDIHAYPATLQKISDRYPEAQIVVPGHGLFGGMELIQHTSRLSKK